MERGLAPFKELIVGKRVFEVPIYQRNYSWEERQLEDLWDDRARDEKPRQNRQETF